MRKSIKNFVRKVFYVIRDTPYLLYCICQLKDDPNFSLGNVDKGLLPRSQDSSSTVAYRTEAARRIIAAYQKANAELASKSDLYKVSNEWIPVFRKPLLPLIEALQRGDADALRELLDNFFRKSISAGLCGLPTDMEREFFTKKPDIYNRLRLLVDGLYRYRLLQRLIPGVTVDDLYVPDFGNPYGIYVNSKFMRNGVDYQYYYAKQVSEALSSIDGRKTVMELGGGIGGFAYFLTKIQDNLTYINLDLPEILCISAYQLLNIFPEKRILLYGEIGTLTNDVIADYDIVLLPSYVIEEIATDSVNISFNSYSLAEIGPDSVVNYVNQISRVTRNGITHINHVSNAVMGGDHFEFDSDKFEIKSRTRALWNLGRNRNCDEYEFVLKRRNEKIR